MKKMDIDFDNRKREERMGKAQNAAYDLIIIGGGVTGAGIALDAALRGLSTLLLEKKDFAAGTSSKSTKLIHGGLRYLKQFELGLVKETGLERAVAHHNIPHLVHPEKMLLPLVEKGTFGKLSASIAISVYDRLANVPTKDRKQTFSRRQTLELEPLLNPSILKSSIQYSEYRTDDARLTVELIKAARRLGAEAFNYMEVKDFIYDNRLVSGVICRDEQGNKDVQFLATQVVSAAGPWVDELRDTNGSKQGKTLQLTKGVHVVLPKEKLPLQSAVYFDAFDGRMLFAIPRGKVTYVGTSDTNYDGDKDKVVCTIADAKYIIKAVNTMFEIANVSVTDIVSSWAGLRPLIHEDGKSPSELSRKDEIFISDTDLISIAGGKLTGYRKMAERIVDLVQEKHASLSDEKCKTKNYRIHSDGFKDYEAFEKFVKKLPKKFSSINLSPYEAWYLTTTYGKHATRILEKVGQSELDTQKALLKYEIEYCILHESCYLPDDYFNRRSGRIYFDIYSVTNNLDFIVAEFARHFKWDGQKSQEIKTLSQAYLDEVTIIKD